MERVGHGMMRSPTGRDRHRSGHRELCRADSRYERPFSPKLTEPAIPDLPHFRPLWNDGEPSRSGLRELYGFTDSGRAAGYTRAMDETKARTSLEGTVSSHPSRRRRPKT